MAYTAEVSRQQPSCFLFLIDQSGSMADALSTGPQASDNPSARVLTRTKAQGVADAVNRLLQNLVIKCAKSEGVRDYYSVGVLGYGHNVGSAFNGTLAGRDMVPISEIANTPARIEERTRRTDDGTGGFLEQTIKFPIWFDPIANGGTPMCDALERAAVLLGGWLVHNQSCFPPVVINITDGESTDGDPSPAAQSLRELSSADGNVLLFNIHVSNQQQAPIEFPDSDRALPDQFAQLLFRMSSLLPDYMRSIAQVDYPAITSDTRGFVFNGDMVSVIKFLDIGTRPSNLR